MITQIVRHGYRCNAQQAGTPSLTNGQVMTSLLLQCFCACMAGMSHLLLQAPYDCILVRPSIT